MKQIIIKEANFTMPQTGSLKDVQIDNFISKMELIKQILLLEKLKRCRLGE